MFPRLALLAALCFATGLACNLNKGASPENVAAAYQAYSADSLVRLVHRQVDYYHNAQKVGLSHAGEVCFMETLKNNGWEVKLGQTAKKGDDETFFELWFKNSARNLSVPIYHNIINEHCRARVVYVWFDQTHPSFIALMTDNIACPQPVPLAHETARLSSEYTDSSSESSSSWSHSSSNSWRHRSHHSSSDDSSSSASSSSSSSSSSSCDVSSGTRRMFDASSARKWGHFQNFFATTGTSTFNGMPTKFYGYVTPEEWKCAVDKLNFFTSADSVMRDGDSFVAVRSTYRVGSTESTFIELLSWENCRITETKVYTSLDAALLDPFIAAMRACLK